MPFELAQVNVARLAAPLTDPLLADFVAAVEHLAAFVYGEMHRQVLRRRREWFLP